MQMWWPLQTILLNWYTVWKIISHSHLPATSSRNLLQISNFHCGRAMDIYKIYYNSLWMKILNLRNDGPWNKTKFLIGLLYHPGKCCLAATLVPEALVLKGDEAERKSFWSNRLRISLQCLNRFRIWTSLVIG